MRFVHRVLIFAAAVAVAVAAARPAPAQTVIIPGPRIQIPTLTPDAAAKISARADATMFVRRDDDPPYVLFARRTLPKGFPADLTPARGRTLIAAFAALAPSMHCRTDDVADAYVFLIQAAVMAYDGSHFPTFAPGPVISCGSTSFGAVALSQTVHINLGTPQFGALPNRAKQALYETLVAFGGYLLENVARSKPGSPERVKACRTAADTIKSLTGFRAERAHLTDAGLYIDDQLRR